MTGFLILLKSVELSAFHMDLLFALSNFCDSYCYLYVAHFNICHLLCEKAPIKWIWQWDALMITPSEPFFLTCLLLLFIIPAGIILPNMLKQTALWQKHLFISHWAVPSVAFAGWQHLKGVWYQQSCERGLWESRPVTVRAAQGVGSGLLWKGELLLCILITKIRCAICLDVILLMRVVFRFGVKGCKTLFCVLIKPSVELSVFWDGKMFRQRGSVVAGFTLHIFKWLSCVPKLKFPVCSKT